MAERKFLFMSSDGYHAEADTADTTTLGGLTMGGDIDMQSNKVTSLAAASASGEALIYGQSGGSLAGLSLTDALAMNNNAITGLPSPSANGDAVNKAYADNIASNIAWKPPAAVFDMIDDSLSSPPSLGSGDAGKAYVVGASPSGDWSGYSEGDIVEWDGSAWSVIISGTGSAPADGTIVIVAAVSGSGAGTFSGHDDDVAEYTAGSGWSFASPSDGEARLIHGDGSYYEHLGYVYDTGTTSWVAFNGAGQVNAGAGLTKSGNTIDVGNGDGIAVSADAIALDLTSNGGLELTGSSPNKTVGVKAGTSITVDSGGVSVDLADTNPGLQDLGTGLEVKVNTSAGLDITSNGVEIDLATTNPGLQFDGSGDLQVDADGTKGVEVGGGGVAVKLESDGAIVFDGTNGGLELNLESTNPTLDIVSNELGVKYSSTASGLDQDTNGLKVSVDGSTITINGSGQLQAIGTDESSRLENDFTASENISAGDPVYLDANADQIAKGDAATDAKAYIMGVARQAISSSASGPVVSYGPCSGVLSSASPGARYFLASGGGLATSPPSGNTRVILVGWAINSTDLFVQPIDYGKKAA